MEAYLGVLKTHEALSEDLFRLFKSKGLSQAQYNVLRILRGAKDPIPAQRIAEDMVTRAPDLTRLVDKLVEAGLAHRTRCTEDRRVVWVGISPAGLRLLAELDAPVSDLHHRQLGHMTQAELRQIVSLLSKARRSE